jgi:hypothetical protein
VDELVRLQVALGDEAFAAALVFADIRSVAGVSPHVRLKKACLLVLLEALAEGTKHELGGDTFSSDNLVVGFSERHLVMVGVGQASFSFEFYFGHRLTKFEDGLNGINVDHQIVLAVHQCFQALNDVM